MTCVKCGVPLVKADRGNIQLGNPDGFEHIDCAKSKYLGPEVAKKSDPKEFPILPEEKKEEAPKEVEVKSTVIPEYEPSVVKKAKEKKPKWTRNFSVKEKNREENSEEASEESEE